MAIRLASAKYLVGAALALGLGSGVAGAQDREDWPDSLLIGTESEGSAYARYGDSVAELLSGSLNIEIGTALTGGSFQNAALMQTGDLDIGLIALGPMYEAWAGHSPLSPTLPHDQLRAVVPVFPTVFQVMTLEGSDIASVEDLAGTIVGAGPSSSASGIYVPRFFETLGFEIEPRNGETDDLALQLRHQLVSALAVSEGVPIKVFIELGPDDPTPLLLPFSEDQQEVLLEEFPSLIATSVPAGTYPDQNDDIQTVSMWHFMVVRADLPEDLVYEITKATLAGRDALAGQVPAAAQASAENLIQNTIVPLHPGAVRYYEEIGLEIPEALKAW